MVTLSTGPAAKLAVRIPTEQAAALDALADNAGVSRSVLVREALSLLLDETGALLLTQLVFRLTESEQQLPTPPPMPPEAHLQEAA